MSSTKIRSTLVQLRQHFQTDMVLLPAADENQYAVFPEHHGIFQVQNEDDWDVLIVQGSEADIISTIENNLCQDPDNPDKEVRISYPRTKGGFRTFSPLPRLGF